MSDVFGFSAESIGGQQLPLEGYRGKLLLVVNTASKCGFTPQYAGLEALYQKYKGHGFEVLGFPCNQFGKQEPADNTVIGEFCERNFGVTFPLFAKIDVNGDNAHPLFVHLKQQAKGVLGTESIKWNFTKFLVGRDGSVIRRFAPKDKPESIGAAIEELL